jgi:hypothetical protein
VTKFIILLTCTLLVISVMYVIPLRLSTKEKLLLSGLAFTFAFCGLFTLNILSYWTSVSLMVCLAFIAAYIVEKRMSYLKSRVKEMKSRVAFMKNGTIYEKAVSNERGASVEEALIETEIHEEISIQSLNVEFPLIEVKGEAERDEYLFLKKDVGDLKVLDPEEDFEFLDKGRDILSEYDASSLEAVELVEEPFVDRSMLFDEIEEMKNEKC